MKSKQEKEFFDALNYIATEKGVDVNSLIAKLENAIILAVRKQYGRVDKINVVIDNKNFNFNVSFFKLVVEVVKNKNNEISLEDAKEIDAGAKIGEYVEINVDAKKIGRLAAQAAKQQIMQGIREIERENVIEKIFDKIGRIITVKVEMVDPVFGNVIFKIDGNEVILFKNQQLPNDVFGVGDMVKVYAVDVESKNADSLIKVSRTHPNFVKSIFVICYTNFIFLINYLFSIYYHSFIEDFILSKNISIDINFFLNIILQYFSIMFDIFTNIYHI